MEEKPLVPAKDPTPDRSQPSATTEKVRKSAESGHGPPVPPKVSRSEHSITGFTKDLEKKPATPPKDLPETQSQSRVKLDDMDERRQYERKMDLEAAQQAAAKLEASQQLVSSFSSPSGSRSRRQTEDKLGSPTEIPVSDTNESAAYLDRDIDDRDILLGLKMAICAACDEDLDAWIRDRTGLRLRRFLADLKAFDAVSKDRKPSASQAPRRQARRTRNETRRLNAERERRRQSTKSKAWKGPCFGEDS
ncbi:hypothetical protein SLS64_004247 [Diaporthe eres]